MFVIAQMLAHLLAQRPLEHRLGHLRKQAVRAEQLDPSDCARASSSSANAASTSGGRSGGSRSARSALRGTISVLVIAWSLSEFDDSESGHVTYTADLSV